MSPQQSNHGQAMLELLISIIAVVVIMVGIVQLGEGGFHQMTSLTSATADASQKLMNPDAQTGAQQQQIIQGWTSGTDQLDYTADDQKILVSQSSIYTLAKDGLSQPVQYPSYNAPYVLNNFVSHLPSAVTTDGWLQGLDDRTLAIGMIDRGINQRVDFGTAMKTLVYGADSISIHTEVYYPVLTGSW